MTKAFMNLKNKSGGIYVETDAEVRIRTEDRKERILGLKRHTIMFKTEGMSNMELLAAVGLYKGCRSLFIAEVSVPEQKDIDELEIQTQYKRG